MTYFGFLIQFLIIPLVILLMMTVWELGYRKPQGGNKTPRVVWLAIGLHVLLAVVYTTPWDNYLVATNVWSYAPRLVSGLVIGWVPVEEYSFFILETLLTGLVWWFLYRHIAEPADFQPAKSLRIGALIGAGLLWLAAVLILGAGWKPGTYLALILVWALPAIAPQLAFGADILWQHRKLLAWTIFPLFIYLSGIDTIAIASGTWHIDLTQSTGIFLWKLPLEEALFFGITAVLIAFGLTLALSSAGHARWKMWMVQSQKVWHSTSKGNRSTRGI
jgi:lycopene beta-cyclase